jgi:hypothetical protein
MSAEILDSFPTAPTIAPTPDVIFVTTPRGQQTPVHPNNPDRTGRPDQRCPLRQDPNNPVHLPHDTDCNRFYKCDHGLAFEYHCPHGQHWNQRRNYCDFPSQAGCRSGNNSGGINIGVPVVPHPPQHPPSPQVPDWPSQWNSNGNNIAQWTNPPSNQNPGFENPIVIPMAPRS